MIFTLDELCEKFGLDDDIKIKIAGYCNTQKNDEYKDKLLCEINSLCTLITLPINIDKEIEIAHNIYAIHTKDITIIYKKYNNKFESIININFQNKNTVTK